MNSTAVADFLLVNGTTFGGARSAAGDSPPSSLLGLGPLLAAAEDDQGGACEVGTGSIPFFPDADWLFAGAAFFQHVYGQVHPYIAAVLCVVGTLMNIVTVVVLSVFF
jgi:hypothetical protein